MNRTLPEMLQRLDTTGNAATVQGTDMSVLERYRDVLKWQQEQIQLQLPQQQLQLQQRCCNGLSMLSLAVQAQNFQGLINGNILGLNALQISDKPNLSAENGWPGFGFISTVTTIDPDHSARCDNGSPGYGEKPAISRTSTPRTMAAAADEVVATATANAKCRQSTTSEMLRATDGKEGFKKRKAEMMLPLKQVDAKEDNRAKKIKACTKEEEAKITYQQQNSNKNSNSSNNGNKDNKNNGEGSGWTSKENSKVFRDQKPDYIHVRALHRQATDSHSLAERVRREKIGERMKYLQDLVPGCNKITGKARMLDEIINYVQSLKRQVEFLSMKLAAINPRLDFNIDDLTVQEVFLASSAANFPSMATSKDIATHSYLPYNPIQQMDQQFQNSLPWEADLQSIFTTVFQQGRPTFPSQT